MQGQSSHGFVFASDDEGNVLAAKKFDKGEEISLKPEQLFDGQTFTLTFFYVHKNPSNAKDYLLNAYTYTDVPRGVQWNELATFLPQERNPPVGTITAAVKKSAGWDGNYLTLCTDYDMESNDMDGGDQWTQELALGMTSAPLIAWDEASDNYRFAVYEDITPGQTVEVNTDDLTQLMTKESVPVPEGTHSLSIHLWGIPDPNEYTLSYYIGGTSQYKVDTYSVQFPDIDLFETFDGTTLLSTDEYDLSTSHRDAKYDITPIDHQFSWTSTQDSRVTFSVAPNVMDNVNVLWMWGEPLPVPYGYGFWNVYTAPGKDREINLPKLPTVVTNFISNAGMREAFAPSTITFGAYEAVDGYAEWMALGTGMGHGVANAYRFRKNWREMTLPLK